MLSYLSYLLFGIAISLGAWLASSKLKTLATIFSSAFYLMTIAYVALICLQDWSWASKLITLSRDAFMVSAFSMLIMASRKVKILPFIILLTFGINYGMVTEYLQGIIPFKLTATQEVHTEKENVSNLKLSSTGELLIELRTKSDINDLDPLVKKYDLIIERAFYPLAEGGTRLDEYYTIDIPTKQLNNLATITSELNKFQDVLWHEPNELLKLDVLPGEPKVSKHNCNHVDDPLDPDQWMHQALEMDKYYGLLETLIPSAKKRAKLFILDSGIDATHEDLSKNYVSTKKQYDTDQNGHGTHCAGIAAAATNNGKGIASFAIARDFVEVSAIKVMNSMGFGSQKQIIDGIIEAVDNGADVISMSLGGPTNQRSQKAYNAAMQYAIDQNAIVIVAAGNSNMDASRYSPANAKGVIAVSAIDEEINKAAFSNTVEKLEHAIAAPGVNIMSTLPDNKYKGLSGTSMACPHVAGLTAIMKSLKPSLTYEQAFNILEGSGKEINDAAMTGNLIQPYKAIKRLVGDMLN